MGAKQDVQVYPYRFVVLCIFCLNSAMTTLTCLQFTSVTAQTSYFFDIDVGSVDWTALVYGVSNVLFIFPACWFFEKKGLRWAIVASSVCNGLGNAIKCASIHENRFYLLLVGQTFCGIGQVFTFPTPSRLAASWFAAGEVSTVSAVAVLSNQAGIGLSFLVTTLTIHDVQDKSILKLNFQTLQYGLSAMAGAIFILTILCMKDKPKSPPSVAAAYRCQEEEEENVSYLASIKRLLKNKNFILHWFSFGLNIATFFNVSTIFTQVASIGFPGHLSEIGWMGCYMSIIGLPASLLCGFYLDKTRRYKLVNNLMYAVSVLACVLLAVMNRYMTNLNWLYIPSTLIGIGFTSYMSVGFELGTEITYPESESTMAGLLFTFVQLFSVVSLPIADKLSSFFPEKVDIFMMSSLGGLLILGMFLTVFIKPDYRRQAAEHKK